MSSPAAAVRENIGSPGRPSVQGRFLFVEKEKFYVKGVTYGAFEPRPDGEYQDAELMEQDFRQMVTNGINTVRIPHTVPPRSLLDAAQRHGLRVMVGLSAEQYIGSIIDRNLTTKEIEHLVLEQVRRCKGHPALLCYALGNEIPAPVVRYAGRRRIEHFLRRLYYVVKSEDPAGIVTYANYPSTEYLHLPWLDLICFNVYLEDPRAFAAYLARLHNRSDDRPLILGELGLDSIRHGAEKQSQALDWQLRFAFNGGCAGAIVFAWTDEWFRSGAAVKDWSFGLTDRDRRPKPALGVVRQAFADVPFPKETHWPSFSVIVCTHNGSRTIRDCLQGLKALDYPTLEIIIVDDGSTDGTAGIASEFDVQVVTAPHRGLAAARNTGLDTAQGELVAFIDDDAWPDSQWLKFLAHTLSDQSWAGAGGPNIEPPGDGIVADSVANAPGGPVHVLLTDTEAEHLPGCNMAFRKEALVAIGGFDPRFGIAGDDVDICWGLQAAGFKLAFSPAAVVWHRARETVSKYWKQQFNYGRAEALLETKWPDKYNLAGHATWIGRVYGKSAATILNQRGRIYSGVRGSAPFQILYPSENDWPGFIFTTPQWYVLLGMLMWLSAIGLLWRPLRMAIPLLVLSGFFSLLYAALNTAHARAPGSIRSSFQFQRAQCLTVFFHLLQPLARLSGRTHAGFCALRNPESSRGFSLPVPRHYCAVAPNWETAHQTIMGMEQALRSGLFFLQAGDACAAWDFEARGGMIGGVRILTAVEDIAAGNQLVRVRSWPAWPYQLIIVVGLLIALALAAACDQAWLASILLGLPAIAILTRGCYEAGRVQSLVSHVLAGLAFKPVVQKRPRSVALAEL